MNNNRLNHSLCYIYTKQVPIFFFSWLYLYFVRKLMTNYKTPHKIFHHQQKFTGTYNKNILTVVLSHYLFTWIIKHVCYYYFLVLFKHGSGCYSSCCRRRL